MAFSVKAVETLSSSHLLRSIRAKSEFDKGFVSAAGFTGALAAAGACSAVVPFSTLPTVSLCRCRERGSIDSWVRPLPLLGKEREQLCVCFCKHVRTVDLRSRCVT